MGRAVSAGTGQVEDRECRLRGELAPLLGVEGSPGVIEPAEQAMIQGILDLEDLLVREIMVPRVDVVAVEQDVPVEELVATIVGAGHSRIPVFRESIDHIVGILYAKDLIPFVLEATTEVSLAELVRPPFVVPDSKRVDILLREMRRTRTHLAIVADEYGGTAGLVTIEDILEEIVGEIQDEYDVETPLIERLGDGVFVIDARVPLSEVEETLGTRFPEDADYETLGGYIQKELARLPREGDRFVDPVVGMEAEILGVEGRRIRRVRLARIARPDGESRDDGRSSSTNGNASRPTVDDVDSSTNIADSAESMTAPSGEQ
jgi:CBS domain containing-hemolysin-like protein